MIKPRQISMTDKLIVTKLMALTLLIICVATDAKADDTIKKMPEYAMVRDLSQDEINYLTAQGVKTADLETMTNKELDALLTAWGIE